MPDRRRRTTALAALAAALLALLTGTRAAAADCTADADCVPDACCHATACVPSVRAPRCEGVACTLECRPGTLDCGGRCVCHAGRCEARPTERD